MNRYGIFNKGLRKLRTLGTFLGGNIEPIYFRTPPGLTATLGWGRRKYSRRARRVAQEKGIPFLCLEDGFLRSIGLGSTEPPLSLVVDDLGIYYDATSPSRLETLIARSLTPDQSSRARAIMSAWRTSRVSKYNYGREYPNILPERYVLVVDQTWDDASIRYGLADQSSFQRMLQSALDEHPECTVLLKIHPQVLAGRQQGYFDLESTKGISRVEIIGDEVHPVSLIEHAQTVYVVTSQMGFEGLLWGKPVRTFGMPFYAGWGLTQDDVPPPTHRTPVPLENLVHAALVDYARYLDPETGQRCEVERLIEWIGLQRRMRTRFPDHVYAFGFSRWKKPILREYCQGSTVHFADNIHQVPEDATLALWGRGDQAGKRPVIRVEDAFLRSVGLGADFVQPLSWVMDRQGMYYDPTAPSELEQLLMETEFQPDLIERAQRLRQRIVEQRLTKYNVGTRTWQRPEQATPVVLVPGQVESDASIRYGTSFVRSNLGLLRAVRETHPSAYIVYKPHPDLLAGLRTKGKDEEEARHWSDEIVTDAAMGELLSSVDEVHVMTSLAGFEALLRERKVVCYGQPFYAGWGLTDDRIPLIRRTRRLTLDELIAATLLLYPTYVSRTTGRFTSAERVLDELVNWRQQQPATSRLWSKCLHLTLVVGKRLSRSSLCRLLM